MTIKSFMLVTAVLAAPMAYAGINDTYENYSGTHAATANMNSTIKRLEADGAQGRPGALGEVGVAGGKKFSGPEAGVLNAAQQGPTPLRLYIQRTRMIHNYDYCDYALCGR